MSETPGILPLTAALDAVIRCDGDLEVLKARARKLWVQVGIELGALKPDSAELLLNGDFEDGGKPCA